MATLGTPPSPRARGGRRRATQGCPKGAFGDKGVHWVLNGIERAQKKYGQKGLRHRVEHNTVNRLANTKRFHELGVVASIQPNITGGQAYRERRLGKERARRVDMWRTLVENDAMLAWGTDWPVSPMNPMFNVRKLVTRYPEQRLTMAETITYYQLRLGLCFPRGTYQRYVGSREASRYGRAIARPLHHYPGRHSCYQGTVHHRRRENRVREVEHEHHTNTKMRYIPTIPGSGGSRTLNPNAWTTRRSLLACRNHAYGTRPAPLV